jgi:hypothetical protein
MTLDIITSKLTSEGLFVIQVEGSTDKDDARDLVFVGDLDRFIQTVKTLKLEVVFATAEVLDQSDFLYEIENDEEEDENIVAEPIHLSSILPSLHKFEKYIGKECTYKLSVRTLYSTLDFYIQEPWWIEFLEMIVEAVWKIKGDRENKRAARIAERVAREKDLLNRLKKLINDSDFINLPTQKAMLIYAIDKIPELEDVDQNILQSEIQIMKAKLTAKGLGRKH